MVTGSSLLTCPATGQHLGIQAQEAGDLSGFCLVSWSQNVPVADVLPAHWMSWPVHTFLETSQEDTQQNES